MPSTPSPYPNQAVEHPVMSTMTTASSSQEATTRGPPAASLFQPAPPPPLANSMMDDTHARFAADSSGAAWDVATSSAARAAQHLDTLHPRAFAHGSNTTSTSHAPLPPPPQLPPPPPPGSFNMEWFDHPTYGPPSSHIAPQQAYHPYYYQHSLHRLHPYYHLRLSGSQHHPVDAPGAGPSSHLPPPSWMSSYSPATAPPPASSHPHQAYRHALDVYQYLYPHHPLPPHPAMDLTEAPFDPRAGFTSHPSQRLSDPSSSISNGHRVYLLSCRHCTLPFSDRGMRAVLLLRPNITLFSTDAVPSHIGPLPTPGVQTDNNEDARTSASSSVRSSRREDEPERTCDCLTQGLGCLGCGNLVGYHIIRPCDRCTSSVNRHQRSANGHRFVFHQNEIASIERRYVPGEPGVLCAPPSALGNPIIQQPSSLSSSASRPIDSPPCHSNSSSASSFPSVSESYTVAATESTTTTTTVDGVANSAAMALALDDTHKRTHDVLTPSYAGILDPSDQHLPPSTSSSAARPVSSSQRTLRSMTGVTTARQLREGDCIYWRDLAQGGERIPPNFVTGGSGGPLEKIGRKRRKKMDGTAMMFLDDICWNEGSEGFLVGR